MFYNSFWDAIVMPYRMQVRSVELLNLSFVVLKFRHHHPTSFLKSNSNLSSLKNF